MVDILNVYKKCTSCNGTGIVVLDIDPEEGDSPIESPCKQCGGSGEILWGQMREEEV